MSQNNWKLQAKGDQLRISMIRQAVVYLFSTLGWWNKLQVSGFFEVVGSPLFFHVQPTPTTLTCLSGSFSDIPVWARGIDKLTFHFSLPSTRSHVRCWRQMGHPLHRCYRRWLCLRLPNWFSRCLFQSWCLWSSFLRFVVSPPCSPWFVSPSSNSPQKERSLLSVPVQKNQQSLLGRRRTYLKTVATPRTKVPLILLSILRYWSNCILYSPSPSPFLSSSLFRTRPRPTCRHCLCCHSSRFPLWQCEALS